MSGFSLTFAFAPVLLLISAAMPEPPIEKGKAVTIPLKEIWAYQMPGTRDVRELEPDKFGNALKNRSSAEQLRIMEQSLTSQILSRLQFNKPGQKATRGFAVTGIGADALHEVYAVIAEGKKPRESFPLHSNLSVVLFSHLFGYYVHLHKIEKQSDKIIIWYRFVPHETKQLTRHFALIPLGEFPPGEVKVEILCSPMQQKFVAAGFKPPEAATDARVVSQSFRFRINSEEAD